MQILPEEGSLFGRIGKGLGQGLGEQIPKEVKKYRLSGGLDELAKNKENLSPLQQAAHLIRNGAEPEQIQSYLPMIQQHQQRQAAIDQSRSSPESQNQISPQGQEPKRSGSNYLKPASPQEIESSIGKLAQDARYMSKSPDELRSLAESQDARRVAADSAHEQRIDLGNKRYDSRLNEKQIANLGDYNTKFRNRVAERIDAGESPNHVADDESRKALNFDKARTKFDTLASRNFYSDWPDEIRKSLDSIRKDYEEAGALEAFSDDLISKEGLSPERANYLAFPVKQNKELNRAIHSQKAIQTAIFAKENSLQKQSVNAAKRIMPFIGDNDSLDSITIELGKQGFDEKAIINEFKKAYLNQELTLTDRQGRETQKPKTWFPNLNDFFLFTMANESV